MATSFGSELSANGLSSANQAPTTPPPTAATALVSPSPTISPGGAPTPCPVAAPQIFVEGKQASASGGQVMFSYLDAQRICSGDENARYVTTGKKLTTKPVSPSAVILLLTPARGAAQLQVPPPALPAAMASGNHGPPYFAITLDKTGTITRIEQSYLP